LASHNQTGSNGSPLLSVDALRAGYRRRPVVFDVSLNVRKGEIVTLLGHNGAGKTTTAKAAFGLLRPLDGAVQFGGNDVTGASPARHVEAGMSFTPAERFVFPDLPVSVNLRLGARKEKSSEVRSQRLRRVHELFPILKERANQQAGTFSGGQQRILSIGMAMMSGASLMVFDEPSLGVSPAIVQEILKALRRMADEEELAILLLEQNVGHGVRESDRVYVMRGGRVILEETGEQMRRRQHWWDLF
jgi:branched-chain amino acid transport system ATP-binding protein